MNPTNTAVEQKPEETAFTILGFKHHIGKSEAGADIRSFKAIVSRPIEPYEFGKNKGGGIGFQSTEFKIPEETYNKIIDSKPDIKNKKIVFLHSIIAGKDGPIAIITDAKLI